MIGTEHYREAEQHIGYAQRCGTTDPDGERTHLGYAQVHATLALAAATAPPARPETPDPWRCNCAAAELGPGQHESYCGQVDDDYPVLEVR